MELMTISEAARRLGYKSRPQLYRLINDGYLHEHVHVQQLTGQRLVEIEGLREKLHVLLLRLAKKGSWIVTGTAGCATSICYKVDI